MTPRSPPSGANDPPIVLSSHANKASHSEFRAQIPFNPVRKGNLCDFGSHFNFRLLLEWHYMGELAEFPTIASANLPR